MRTVHFRSLSIAAIAVLTFAGSVAAQEKPSGLLNSLEVQQLVKRAEPGDHARLGTHFAALAERSKAEAQRHTSMLQAYTGNPRITQTAFSMSAHCRRLAELNTQSATTLIELAAHHEKLAAGAPSSAPRDSARFQEGTGAPDPGNKDVSALVANARAASDHRALEDYFSALAKRHTRDADEHAAYAVSWRGMTRVPTATITAAHCEKFSGQLREAAEEANAAAAMHKQLAGVAR